ncbi:puratrophin-1, partial [Bombina bombina]|uniref:puratrophin-1 n=1 Tax=Bombina bombina TaxID=8345 RepID=UPI00235B0725
MAAELYNRVDEGVHSLVKLSNKRIQEMELVIEFDAFEEQFCEVGSWIENVGERLLRECTVLEDSLEVLLQTQRRFQEFYVVALEYCRRAQEMMQISEKWQSLSSPEIQKYRVKLQRCKDKLGDFSWRLEEARTRLEKTVMLYQFFDKRSKVPSNQKSESSKPSWKPGSSWSKNKMTNSNLHEHQSPMGMVSSDPRSIGCCKGRYWNRLDMVDVRDIGPLKTESCQAEVK